MELGFNNAVVVAHPDDETLWAGGLIAENRHLFWTVICCTIPRRDPVRAWKFFDACEVLGARAVLMPFSEAAMDLSLLKLEHFDCVITHNAAGEYGHPQHQAVHQAVKAQGVWGYVFGYGQGALRQDYSPDVLARKRVALEQYNHGSPPKWQALLERYGAYIEKETFDALA